MTGMVTALMQKSFGHLSLKWSSRGGSPEDSARITIRVLAPMWISFILGAFTGAMIVSSFSSNGLLGIGLMLILLIFAELKIRMC
jgi:uncharacterized membrane protein YoaK (UPF0700 family)